MATDLFELHWVQRDDRRIDRVLRPADVYQALAMLEADPEAQPIAGGTDLLPGLRGEPGPPLTLIDLTAIRDFGSVVVDDRLIRLGGGVTHATVVANEQIVAEALPLAQACREIGSPQLRNRATIAGNVRTASPANDTLSALMALGATIELARRVDGDVQRRLVPIGSFFTGFRETVCEPTELITAIRVPTLRPPARGVWVKVGLRAAQAISVVHAACVIESSIDGLVVDARIALGSVGPVVGLNEAAQRELIGSRLSDEAIDRAADVASETIEPIDDGRATADYRRSATRTAVRRALRSLAGERERDHWEAAPPTLRRPQRGAPVSVPRSDIDSSTEVTVELNGRLRTGSYASSPLLLDWIRAQGLTGTKEGCAEGECGACTVLIDGAATMSCLVNAAQADGRRVTTIEGVTSGIEPQLHPVQRRLVETFGVQCGFCTPGFVMAIVALAQETAAPTDSQIREALAGNLCRCTGYYSIIAAARLAIADLQS